ncbi:hypothetical protein LCGC14_2167580, partial [marine sediment metagenome]
MYKVICCILLQSAIVYGMSSCLEIQSPGVSCMVLTPVVDCGTYDLYNSTNELNVDD